MSTKNHGTGRKKTHGKTAEKNSSFSNQEKKEPKQADLTKKIKEPKQADLTKHLEDDNKRLISENVMLKKNFDLREIIKALSTKGVTEVDAIEIAKDMVKMALKEAEEKHSAEKTDMEKKHKKEIEKLSQNLQGEDQLPTKSTPQEVTDGKSEDYLKSLLVEKQQLTKALEEEKMEHVKSITELESKYKGEIEQLKRDFNGRDQLPTDSSGDSQHSQETDKEIAEFREQNKELEREVESLKAEKDELNNNIKILMTEKDSLNKKLKETEVLLRQKETEITNMKKDVKHDQTSEKSKGNHLEKEETTKDVNHSHEGEKTALVDTKQISVEMQNLELTIRELKEFKEECKNLKDKLKKTEELLSQKESEVTDMKKELANLTPRGQDTISNTVNPDDIHLLMRETTKEIEKANSEKNALLAGKQKLEAEIQKLQDENKKQKESYEKSKEQKEKEKDALLAEKQQKDAEIETLQNENKALKQLEEKNKNLNENLKKLEEEKDILKQKLTELQNENDEVKYRLKESRSPSLSNVISANDNKAVQQLKDENERLRKRLSEMAGAQMTLNNPNIADLSDAFRPTKLSEEYSQLYDNLWTDAFEEHGDKKEEDIIQILGKTLLDSYKFCEKVCREFTVQLTNSSLSLPNSKPKTGDIPIVYKKQLQDMKKSFGVFLRNDVKESYRKQNTIEGGEKTKNYIDACVELCWLMVIQEPPVVIETPASKDSAFDSDTYRTYTKIGRKVDFVVWPALRLHQGGPLLTKGVAQGKN